MNDPVRGAAVRYHPDANRSVSPGFPQQVPESSMSEEDLSDDWFERALEEQPVSEGGGADDSSSAEASQSETEGSEDRPSAPDRTATEASAPAETGAGDADSLFDRGFGDALDDVDTAMIGDAGTGPDGFGDVDFGLEADEPDFDEELETSLSRIEVGVEGLDRMIQGGVPQRSLMVAIGSAGTGKTTFGLQFLNHGLENGERAVYITLEETRDRVINSATEKGWRFDEFAEKGDLAVVDVDPIRMATHLDAIQDELPTLIEDFGASRLVLDSVSLLEMMYDDQAKRRNEIYEFTSRLKDAGVTALLTSEAAAATAYASRHGIVEYLTDAVFVLQYVRPDDFRETRLAVEIQKIRDANHSREKKPYEITNGGISVHQQANLF